MLSQEEIAKLKQEYEHIYATELLGIIYIWRRLTKAEYARIDTMDATDEEKEELACQLCILHPFINYDHCPAGIPSTLIDQILIESGFDEQRSHEILQEYRHDMSTLESQMEAIIMCAYPNLTVEEMDHWDVPKTLRYFTRAEWILTVLQGIPVGKILADLHSTEPTRPTPSQLASFPELRNEL